MQQRPTPFQQGGQNLPLESLVGQHSQSSCTENVSSNDFSCDQMCVFFSIFFAWLFDLKFHVKSRPLKRREGKKNLCLLTSHNPRRSCSKRESALDLLELQRLPDQTRPYQTRPGQTRPGMRLRLCIVLFVFCSYCFIVEFLFYRLFF